MRTFWNFICLLVNEVGPKTKSQELILFISDVRLMVLSSEDWHGYNHKQKVGTRFKTFSPSWASSTMFTVENDLTRLACLFTQKSLVEPAFTLYCNVPQGRAEHPCLRLHVNRSYRHTHELYCLCMLVLLNPRKHNRQLVAWNVN